MHSTFTTHTLAPVLPPEALAVAACGAVPTTLADARGSTAAKHVSRAFVFASATHLCAPVASAAVLAGRVPDEASMRRSHSLILPSVHAVATPCGSTPGPAAAAAHTSVSVWARSPQAQGTYPLSSTEPRDKEPNAPGLSELERHMSCASRS